jgi:CRP-like cAMP-binding protein
LARRTVGDLVGELAIVSSAPRSATVTALEPTRLAVVSADVIERELATASPLLARMVRSLSDRLREETRRR